MNRMFLHKTVFIAGSEKNAGKTTFLNYLLRRVRPVTTPAFLSIGVDGETRDLVFGTQKPRIFTEPGDFLVTTGEMLDLSDGLFELREVFPFRTALGRIVAAKTLRSGHVELVGPETNDQLAGILSYLRAREGIDTILVDGAAGRITQVAAESSADDPRSRSTIAGSFAYVLKVTPGNLNTAVDKLKRLTIMEDIPAFEPAGVKGKTFFVRGALTRQRADSIPDDAVNLVIDDFTKIFLDWRRLKRLAGKNKLHFRQKYDLLCAVLVLHDVSREDFLRISGNSMDAGRLFFNPYQDAGKGAGAA